MAAILANVRIILRSLFSPSQPATVPITDARRDGVGIEESDTGEDVTLGKKKSPPKKGQDSKAQAGAKAAPQMIAPLASPQLVISPAFLLVLKFVFVLILVLLSAMVLIAIFGSPTNSALQTASSIISTAFTASLGAVLGLIGGKALQ
jgi:hypothetical protein